MNEDYWQQGDCLFFPIDKIPHDGIKLKTNIIQSGEATNHHHRADSMTSPELFEQPKTKKRHLRLLKPTTITHEEHKPIELPPGDYEVRIVKEYDHFKEESRAVLD